MTPLDPSLTHGNDRSSLRRPTGRCDAYHRGVAEPQALSEPEFREIYRRVPRLTVEVVLADEAGVLLTRRAIDPCRGMWHLPGGTVRFGERLTDAVARVARDELGIEVQQSRMLGCIEYPSHYEHGLDSPVGLAFLVVRHSGTVVVTAAASEHDWFRRLPSPMHEEQVRFLEDAGIAVRSAEGQVATGHTRRNDSGQ